MKVKSQRSGSNEVKCISANRSSAFAGLINFSRNAVFPPSTLQHTVARRSEDIAIMSTIMRTLRNLRKIGLKVRFLGSRQTDEWY